MRVPFTFSLSICLCLIHSIVFSQKDFQEGVITLKNSDKMIGEIDLAGNNKLSQWCTFRKTQTQKAKDYYPNEIKEYVLLKTNRKFVSKAYKGEMHFLEILIKGKLNLYKARINTGDFYFLEDEANGLTAFSFEKGFTKTNGKLVKSQSYAAKGVLSLYMKNAPHLSQKIHSLEEPSQNEIKKLIKRYLTDNKNDFQEFDKTKRKSSILLEPNVSLGSVNWGSQGYSYNAGSMVHFGLPAINTRVYFTTGLNYFQFSLGKTIRKGIRIPF